MEMNNDSSLIQINRGLNMDFEPLNQPEGTYRYALNAVIESQDGDFLQLSNEISNSKVTNLPKDFICIGSVYIDDNKTVVFLVKKVDGLKHTISEIGIIHDSYEIGEKDKYITWCNDENSDENKKLNFNPDYRIQAIYRLRRGCEKTVYWVDGFNQNRSINLNNKDNYLTNGKVDKNKFSIQKIFSKVPLVKGLEILEDSGSIPNGSLTILLQYLDSEKNGTKWISEIPLINIYSDNHKEDYYKIDGSINNKDVKEFNNRFSNKAVKVSYKNFDTSYKFFRLAFIHYYSNTKKPTACYLSDVLTIDNNGNGEFIYTGNNFSEKTTYEEIALFNNSNKINYSKTLTQKDNRLIFGNSSGESVNWGLLQKYASKIATDCIAKKVNITDSTNIHNSKNPFVKFFGSGFMPMEIYSLGIVYVFDDLTESPVYHIPGKNQYTFNKRYFNEDLLNYKVFPMNPVSNLYNLTTSELGNVNKTLKYTQRECDSDFDLWGVDSEGMKLKNTDVRFHRFPNKRDLNLTGESDDSKIEENFILGVLFTNVEIPTVDVIGKKCIGYYFVKQEIKDVDRTILDSGYLIDLNEAGDYKCVSAQYSDMDFSYFNTEFGGLTPRVSPYTKMLLTPSNMFLGKTLDEFSYIAEVGRVKVKKESKTGFLIQNVSDLKSDSMSNESAETRQNDGADLKAIIRDLELTNINSAERNYVGQGIYIERKDADLYYLNPYEKANIKKKDSVIYNIDGMSSNLYIEATDESLCFGSTVEIQKNSQTSVDSELKKSIDKSIPYVYIIRKNTDFYSDFLKSPYYRITETFSVYNDNINMSFDGDSYICGYRHTMSSYCDTSARQPILDNDKSTLLKIGLIILSAIVTAVSFGTALAIVDGALIAAGGIFYGLRAKVAVENFNRTYQQDWKNSLRYLFQDNFYINSFVTPDIQNNPRQIGFQDDTIKFYNLILGDFIFETPINISLRIEPNDDDNNYLRPFTEHQPDNLSWKVSVKDNITPTKNSINTYFTVNGTLLWKSWYTGVPIETKEEKFFLSRLCEKDSSRYESKKDIGDRDNISPINEVSGYKFYGSAKPIFYCINQDYLIQEKVNRSYVIPFEYSLCSNCGEKFPQRLNWSDISFSEQLTDNYRILKPNNYKDIDGEYGEIVNLFVLNNQFYIHTKNGLWLQPTNYQERVTNGVVTYIGTGEFCSLPAQLIVNSKTGNSVGLNNISDSVLTTNGYFFVCQDNCKVYLFNGQLTCISDIGMSRWFSDNIIVGRMNGNKDFFRLNFDYYNNRLLVSKVFSPDEEIGWTLSFNLKTNSWVSFHSFLPDEYIQIKNNMYTIKNSGLYFQDYFINSDISRNYQTYYGKKYPFIVEYVDNKNPLITKVFDSIRFLTTAKKVYPNSFGEKDERYTTFNKAILYNSYQCTNLLNLITKNNIENTEYILNQLNDNDILLDKVEKDWCINNFRDKVTNYDENIFIQAKDQLYYSLEDEFDKKLNPKAFEGDKQWYELSSLRDKYLVVRLIFDTFADTKLLFNFSSDYNKISQY